ncbi:MULTISPECIES: GNAT family N-acetyltransferase [unclassified Cellulomonas]|uniref:GNAT family N-acetyltransferase n=1 Tax=unclassified Cellulomonas TaxID=2620175 RepID=UPI0019A94E0F|nr:GNAT family N-acetyltransferase [Cellulomonas sp. ES6]MBD3779670.1 GNAT family N-acetyltransferase [Micrococcales bacterium]WHP18420.1 GNAT family N-acetyltransferase [Cellulomonas sp. ES6]
MQVRPFSTCDLAGMYRVCLLTGDVGADGTRFYRDPDLLGHVYAAPYPVADPGLTWVVTDEDGVAGYVVGTADSQAFARWQEDVWWPPLRERYPLRPEVAGLRDHDLLRTIHDGSRYEEELTAAYPAHLHIDLLPRAQGRGLGRTLIETLTGALRGRGVPGVHLKVSEQNTGAIAFYARVGFHEVATAPWGRTLGMDLRA